jgi:hypothetical protein
MVTGEEVYPHRADLYEREYLYCEPCQAWVGCHPDGTPMGMLADAELRKERMEAHRLFNTLWQTKLRARASEYAEGTKGWRSKEIRIKKECMRAGYMWLAAQMGIPPRECHIAMFDVEQCKKVQELCRPHAERIWVRGRKM